MILHREFTHHTGKIFEVAKKIKVVVGCSYNLLAFKAKFELVNRLIMEYNFCNRLHCICDCTSDDSY